MAEPLEFQDVTTEFRGTMCPGRLKMTDQNIVFKNKKTGKVEQINGPDLEFVNWQKLVGTWALRVFLKNGGLHRFAGFKESEIEKIGNFFKSAYNMEMPEKELSVKGWNWGAAKFVGNVLSYEVNNTAAFEIPLKDVSQCTTGKNEVTMEFHQNDEASESLLEMRFYIPTNELAGDTDPVEAFKENVMRQASVINISGDALAVFNEIQCLTPRGRYDIKVFGSFFQLHGKTFDYKIPISTVLRLFTLPHKDGRQNFFVISLDPPIKQGQTRYPYLTLLFNQDETSEIELPLSEEELKEKYEGKLEKELNGPTFEVMAKLLKVLVNRKITVPGSFKGHSGTPAVSCSYKAAAGYIYPLERGFIFIHKPPMHIRFEEIATVNFARSGGSTRSFDFEIELKTGVVHTFSSIEKDEYGKLFDFIQERKLRVKNTGKGDKPNYKEDFGSSGEDDKEPDAYLARVKREAAERDDDDDDDDEDESTDEDFNPDQVESDVAEEYDSNPTPTDSSVDSDASEGTKKKKEKAKKKKTITISERPRKEKKEKSSSSSSKKKKKDKNAPKKPMSAYMWWFNDNREKIKKDNPGISFTDIAKKGGELWKNISSSEKASYDEKVKKAKEEYEEAMKEYKEKTAENSDDEKESKPKKTTSSKKPSKSVPAISPSKIKSKEYIDDDSSSDSDADDKKRKKADSDSDNKASVKKVKKEKKSESEEEESEEEKSPKKKSKDTVTKVKKESEEEESEEEKSPKKKSKDTAKAKTEVKKEADIDDEDYDEPVESTPPSSDAGSGSESGSDSDNNDDD